MKDFQIISLVLLISVAASCEQEPDWHIDRTRINEVLSLASDQITIDGTTMELHAYLWRDFMPISPPDGKELISINWLVDTDSVGIADHITLSQQYVIHGDSIWTADYTTEKRETVPFIQERISRNGPKWGPYVEVTVVAKVVDLSDGSEFYLRRDHQTIERTD